MKRLLVKIILYFVLIILVLEILVRFFHLTKDYPTRYVDEFNVEKWKPNQEGYSVTGIRRQNLSKYHINNSGFNSFREFTPSKDGLELALVGDSFIEGFHQDYYNSIGFKIEKEIENLEVYEYGYAGYDLADQLHLIHQYKSTFDLINFVIIGLDFENDLERSEYNIVEYRMRLETPIYKNLRKIKLLVITQNLGLFDSFRELISKFIKRPDRLKKQDVEVIPLNHVENEKIKYQKRIDNFESLIKAYGFDKSRFTFFINIQKTPKAFLSYLIENNYKYIDFHKQLNKSKLPTTLIYDFHWNDNGRSIVASEIINYLKLNN